MLVSVIIPCKNEPYLEQLVRDIDRCLVYPHEILTQKELGLSSAVLAGMKKSKGDVMIILDADGSHNPKYLNRMVESALDHSIVVGSRYVRGGATNDSSIRHFLSLLFCKIAQQVLKIEIQDPMSGFVALKRQVLVNVPLQQAGYKFLLELIAKSNHQHSILEYPIVFEKRKMGNSHTGIKEGVETIVLIFKLWSWKNRRENLLNLFSKSLEFFGLNN